MLDWKFVTDNVVNGLWRLFGKQLKRVLSSLRGSSMIMVQTSTSYGLMHKIFYSLCMVYHKLLTTPRKIIVSKVWHHSWMIPSEILKSYFMCKVVKSFTLHIITCQFWFSGFVRILEDWVIFQEVLEISQSQWKRTPIYPNKSWLIFINTANKIKANPTNQ